MSSYWYSILSHYERNNFVNNGLTIPFLIGSRSIIEPNKPLYSINGLFKEMSEVGITLMLCDTLREYIVGVMDRETIEFSRHYPNYGKRIEGIFITDSSCDQVNNLSALIELMEAKYSGIISSGNYSWNQGDWSAFSREDLTRLNS